MNLRAYSLWLSALIILSAFPQRVSAQVDVIRGRVTNAEGTPLGNVRVTATSIPGNVTREARTNGSGNFQIAFPGGAGDYMMGYALVGHTFRQYEIKRTADQDVLVADARLAAVQLDTVTVVAPVQQRVSRNSATPDVSGTERAVTASVLPADLQGNIAAMAASLPGVTLIPGLDGAADGFSVLGLGADQNSVMLNGVQYDGNGLPRDANISSSLATSPYDPSRGGFSGAQFNVSSRGGSSNYRTRGLSLVANAPQLQWTDLAARALGTEYTNVSLGGVASGPLKLNKAFYNSSFQLGRQSRDNSSLLTTEALGLQTAGVSIDSVSRFLNVLEASGIPLAGGPTGNSRVNDNASFLTSIDISPPNSSSGSSYGMSVNGNWSQSSPVGGGATSLNSASGDRTSWGGGVQIRQNRYIGLLLSETNAGFNYSTSGGRPYLDLPGGRVRVNSELNGGASGVQNLSFGGAQGLNSRSASLGSTISNTISWFDNANKHRIKLNSEIRYNASEQQSSYNLLGTFVFNSIEDLEAGRPSLFSRQLNSPRRSSGQFNGAVSIGDSYRRTPNLQIQYGLRVEGNRYTESPEFNPLVSEVFDRRTDFVPYPVAISPRIGFSYTLGSSREVASFDGAFRGPRAVIRGGIGLFANGANLGSIGSVIDNTGLPSSIQQLTCVGDAAPTPDWNAYRLDPRSAPTRCADSSLGTVFSNNAPNVTIFSRHFAPQQSVRSNLSWSGSILDARYSTTLEATYAINQNQQRTIDLNFRPDAQFQLEREGGRPVFVLPTSIVEATGSIASRDARVSQSFSRVSELRSDLQSQTAQLSLRLSPIYRRPTKLSWSAAYTYTGLRQQLSGFSSTAANPLQVEWTQSANGPHQFTYNLRYNFFDYVQVSWNGQFRSGAGFTPMIAGDVNGDGYSNDRAYIIDPLSVQDATLAADFQRLLDGSSASTRSCLRGQMGSVASANSCRAPWSSNASLNITLDRARFRMPQRASVNFSLSNPLGAADLALNGSGRLRGWGQTAFPDQSLLYVRGFDAATRQYRYEVNQRFGATRPQYLTLRSPVSLTMSVRVDLGPMREQQMLRQQSANGRVPESVFRSIGTNSITNPMSTILRSQDSLRLTSVQADSIASMNRRYTYRNDSLWTPVARRLVELQSKPDDNEGYDRFLAARHAQIDMLIDVSRAIRDLLTSEQLRKLPAFITNSLDPRYLRSIRNGTGLYVTGGGGGYFSSPGEGMFEMRIDR